MPNALQITDPNADNPLAQAPSWADAYGSVTGSTQNPISDLQTWLAAQRAKSAQMGLWNDQTGLPTGKGLVSAAGQTGNALLMGTTAPGIRAFHGSPYDFERFDASKIGTGEGAQAYGRGLYFAEKEGTAESYRDALTSKFKIDNQPVDPTTTAHNLIVSHGGDVDAAINEFSRRVQGWTPGQVDRIKADATLAEMENLRGRVSFGPGGGSMYEVNIGADPEQFLHWDQTVGQHPPAVRDKLLDMGYGDTDRGADVYSHLARGKEGDAGASQRLLDAGIPGIRYLDQGSRGDGEGTRNTVVFDANTIDILRKYGLAGLGIGLSGAAAGTQGQPQQ